MESKPATRLRRVYRGRRVDQSDGGRGSQTWQVLHVSSGLRGRCELHETGRSQPGTSRGRCEERERQHPPQGQLTISRKGKEPRRTRKSTFLFKHSTRQDRFANTTCIHVYTPGMMDKRAASRQNTTNMKNFPGLFKTTGVIYFNNNILFHTNYRALVVSVVYSSGIPSYSEYPSARFMFSGE